jgi:hypothetical protein
MKPKPRPAAFNAAPRGIPLDEWTKMQNAAKRERRKRRVKR